MPKELAVERFLFDLFCLVRGEPKYADHKVESRYFHSGRGHEEDYRVRLHVFGGI